MPIAPAAALPAAPRTASARRASLGPTDRGERLQPLCQSHFAWPRRLVIGRAAAAAALPACRGFSGRLRRRALSRCRASPARTAPRLSRRHRRVALCLVAPAPGAPHFRKLSLKLLGLCLSDFHLVSLPYAILSLIVCSFVTAFVCPKEYVTTVSVITPLNHVTVKPSLILNSIRNRAPGAG